jgi:hypothetical protein
MLDLLIFKYLFTGNQVFLSQCLYTKELMVPSNDFFLIKDYKSGLYIHTWTYTAKDYNGALRLQTS